jgi:hypothetical protein
MSFGAATKPPGRGLRASGERREGETKHKRARRRNAGGRRLRRKIRKLATAMAPVRPPLLGCRAAARIARLIWFRWGLPEPVNTLLVQPRHPLGGNSGKT